MPKNLPKELKTDPSTRVEAAANTEADGNVPPAEKKKRGLLIPLLVLALLLGAGGGGAWYFLQDDEPAVTPGRKNLANAPPARATPYKSPEFTQLESFTVNLQPENSSTQFLQVGLSLKIADASVGDAIKLHMPEIRNRVLLLLTSKRPSEISSLEGKKALSAALLGEIFQPIAGRVPPRAIESVLFTSFVIQ